MGRCCRSPGRWRLRPSGHVRANVLEPHGGRASNRHAEAEELDERHRHLHLDRTGSPGLTSRKRPPGNSMHTFDVVLELVGRARARVLLQRLTAGEARRRA